MDNRLEVERTERAAVYGRGTRVSARLRGERAAVCGRGTRASARLREEKAGVSGWETWVKSEVFKVDNGLKVKRTEGWSLWDGNGGPGMVYNDEPIL